MGTGGHGGQGMGFVTREEKHCDPQWADNLLVGGEKNIGNGVCHGTKKTQQVSGFGGLLWFYVA